MTRARRRSTFTTSPAGWAERPGMWGYVMGGMGMVSFILCDIARDAGAVVLTGVPVARIIPGSRRRARGRRANRISLRRLERRPARDPAPSGQ